MQEQVATGGGAARHRPRRSACGRIGCGEMRPPIWRSPNFLKLWSAGTVSDLGSEITELALPLTAILILHATPSEIGVQDQNRRQRKGEFSDLPAEVRSEEHT